MRFSFRKPYRFECLKAGCALCCYGSSLSLTREDYLRWRGLRLRKRGMRVNPNDLPLLPYEVVMKRGKCHFLKGGLCSVYHLRPVLCRLYPLTLSFLPDGELFVNLLRCPGVGENSGSRVDEAFVSDQIGEAAVGNYLSELREDRSRVYGRPVPFYGPADSTDFGSKRWFMAKIPSWVFCKELEGEEVGVRCSLAVDGLLEVLKDAMKGAKRGVLGPEDVRFIAGVIDDRLPDLLLAKRAELERPEEVQAPVGARVRFEDFYGRSYLVELRAFYEEKGVEASALETLREYFVELFDRVDMGGFFPSSPMPVILLSLKRFALTLNAYIRLHARGEDSITARATEEAIRDVDTKISASVMGAEITGELIRVLVASRLKA